MKSSESKQLEYGEEYRQWKSWIDTDFGALDSLERSYFEAEIRRAKVQPSAVKKVLEIGFGNGAFLEFGRALGWDIVGSEVNPALIKAAHEKGYTVVQASDLSEFADENFDLIAAFDVLEHIPKSALAEFFHEVKRKLKPSGVFIARFPNGDSPLGLPNQNGDLTHVTAIGSEIGRYLASQAGLRVVFFGAEAMPLMVPSFKHCVHRVVSCPIKLAVNFVINKLILSGASVEFCSSNLTLIAQKPEK